MKQKAASTPQSQIVHCNNINDAKKALKQRYEIKYHLPNNITTEKLLEEVKELGLNIVKLEKILTSSMVLKKIIDNYLKTKPKYGYLKYCTEVIPLKCNKNKEAQIKIKDREM